MGKKPQTLLECQEFAKSKGGLCLSTEYKNVETTMPWQCEHGYIWNATFHSILNGTWCYYCNGTIRCTLEDCIEYARQKEGKCFEDHYVNMRTKMVWECKFGHKWSTTFGCIKAGQWCAKCAGLARLTLDDCIEWAKNKNVMEMRVRARMDGGIW